jgi:gliding motility-associated-like protein
MKQQTFLAAFSLFLGIMAMGNILYAQPTYNALPVTGFNQDIVAENGPGALDATTVPVDGSNHSIYSAAFASTFQFGAPSGGLPDNGTISNSVFNWQTGLTTAYNFQLADYASNNALVLSDLTGTVAGSVSSGTLTLVTPSVFTWLSVMSFSTEGGSNLTLTFNFTDGTSAATPTTYLNDWFGYGPDVVLGGMGWTDRISPTLTGTSAWNNSSNSWQTQAYAWNIMVPCAGQGKAIQSVTFNYIGGDPGAHRAHILGLAALAGTYTTPSFATDMLPARCGNDNGILSVTNKGGGVSPFTYSWSTTPVQTTNIITGLTAGDYTCTVADSNGCTFLFTGTVTKVVASTLTAVASPASVCAGASTTLTVSDNSATPNIYTWAPNSQTGTSVTVSPGASTTYTVTGKDFYGCTSTATIDVVVNSVPTAAFSVNPDPSCSKTPQTVTFTGTAGSGATYNWNNFSGATVTSGSGAGPYTIEFDQPGAYDLQLAVSDNGCTSSVFSQSVSVLGVAGAPVITVLSATSNSVTFSWQPVPGATGYQVSVNDGPYTDPSSGSTGTTHTVTGLGPQTSVKLNVIALSGGSCQSSPMGTNTGKTLGDAVFIPNSFTPNGDGKNDVFKIYSNQATGMDMRIFDQWGELLYSTTNLNGGWDGTYKGKVQPSGVYIYAIRVTLTDGTQTVRKGSINLVH